MKVSKKVVKIPEKEKEALGMRPGDPNYGGRVEYGFTQGILESFEKAGYTTKPGSNSHILSEIMNEMLVDYRQHLYDTILEDSFWHSKDIERVLQYAESNYGVVVQRPRHGVLVTFKSINGVEVIDHLQQFGDYTFISPDGKSRTVETGDSIFLSSGSYHMETTAFNGLGAAPIFYTGYNDIHVKQGNKVLKHSETLPDGTYAPNDFSIVKAGGSFHVHAPNISQDKTLSYSKVSNFDKGINVDLSVFGPDVRLSYDYVTEGKTDVSVVRDFISNLVKQKKMQMITTDDIEVAVQLFFKAAVSVLKKEDNIEVYVDSRSTKKIKKYIVDNSRYTDENVNVIKMKRVDTVVDIRTFVKLSNDQMREIANAVSQDDKFQRVDTKPFNKTYVINKVLFDLGYEDFEIELEPGEVETDDVPLLSILTFKNTIID